MLERCYLFFLSDLYTGTMTNAPEINKDSRTGPSILLTEISTK